MQQCLAKAHARYPIAKVILGAGAESYVRLVESKEGWNIYGNSSVCIEKLRDPQVFFSALDELSISYPQVSFQLPPDPSSGWLSKKSSTSCGGLGVRRLSKVLEQREDCYWQEELKQAIPGVCIVSI